MAILWARIVFNSKEIRMRVYQSDSVNDDDDVTAIAIAASRSAR